MTKNKQPKPGEIYTNSKGQRMVGGLKMREVWSYLCYLPYGSVYQGLKQLDANIHWLSKPKRARQMRLDLVVDRDAPDFDDSEVERADRLYHNQPCPGEGA